MDVLQKELNLLIDDLGAKPDLCEKVKQYHGLLDDYIARRGETGALHIAGQYQPIP